MEKITAQKVGNDSLFYDNNNDSLTVTMMMRMRMKTKQLELGLRINSQTVGGVFSNTG